MKCFYHESEPTNGEKLKIGTINGTPDAPDEVHKPRRSCNTQGPLTDLNQLEEIDEIALIKAVLEKMGHEVRLFVLPFLMQVVSFYF